MKLTQEIRDYGILRRKQGQAEGLPYGVCIEAYDLMYDADTLLKEIVRKVEVMSDRSPEASEVHDD